jgi:hypothetical protein
MSWTVGNVVANASRTATIIELLSEQGAGVDSGCGELPKAADFRPSEEAKSASYIIDVPGSRWDIIPYGPVGHENEGDGRRWNKAGGRGDPGSGKCLS